MNIFSQDKIKMTASFDLHLNPVYYDPVKPGPGTVGRGFGFQMGLILNTAFMPILEYDYDEYFMGPQELVYITYKGKNVKKSKAFNCFGGLEITIFKGLKMDFLIGTSFLDSYKYLAVKPAMLYSFGKNERFFGKIAFTYVRTIYGDTVQPFEYYSVSAGVKIF